MNRNDAGTTLAETVVSMTISAMLLGGVLSTMFLSVKLVNTAPPDTNPHTFGAVAAAVARLEGSATADLTCTNPSGVNSRKDCVEVTSAPQTPTRDGDALCWVVDIGADRRRECWELLPQGDLVAYRYAPDVTAPVPPAPPAETCSEGLAEDCLSITGNDPTITYPGWLATSEESLPRASGLVALEWNTTSTPVTLTTCAAIRPDQRQLMAPDEVPFCEDLGVTRGDGSQGVLLGDGIRAVDLGDGNPPVACTDALVSQRWVCIEGYAMPTLRVLS